VTTDFLALRLFCFNIRQHGRQVLYFKLHVDGRKFHYGRPQVVHRCPRGNCSTMYFTSRIHQPSSIALGGYWEIKINLKTSVTIKWVVTTKH